MKTLFLIFFSYGFMYRDDGKNPREQSDDEQSSCQGAHSNSPFLPGWKIVLVGFRNILHRKKGMQQRWRNNEVSFKPCANHHHNSGYEGERRLSSLSGQ